MNSSTRCRATMWRFSPDGRHVVTASFDRRARVWNYATGEPAAEPIQHPDWVLTRSSTPTDGTC